MASICNFATISVLSIFKLIVIVYDLLTLPLYLTIQKPWRTVKRTKSVRAVQLDPCDASSAWIRSGAQPKHFITECRTIDEAVRRTIESSPKWKQCLGYRQVTDEEVHYIDGKAITKVTMNDDYAWLTYDQLNDRINHVGRGLMLNGVKPRDKVMIFAETSIDWFVCAQSLFRFGASVATLYATLSDDSIVHGMNDTEVTHVIVSQSLLPKLQRLQKQLPLVTTIVYIDGVKSPVLKGFDHERLKLVSLSVLEETGRHLPAELVGIPPTEDDIAVVLYTSGSTGIPKGVIITHRNFMRAASSYLCIVDSIMKEANDHRYIAYLPLAHILEFATETFLFIIGVKIGYSSPYTLTDRGTAIKIGHKGDASLLRPTLMAAVPLVLDRIRKGIYEKIDKGGPIGRQLFDYIVHYKTFWVNRGFDTPLLNRLVCRKFQELIGGELRYMMVGGAPLSQDTQRLIKACLDVTLFQGYAATETTGVGMIMDEYDRSLGRVGAPLFGMRVRLVDWDEGGYKITDKPNPRGEIMIGSAAVSMGYFKLDSSTREAYYYDESGMRWFLTGDIGEVFPDGTFKIIDRKRDLIKLQFGEYVSLGKIEAELKNSVYVENICVIGNSYHNYLVAIIIPNREQLKRLADGLGIAYETPVELYSNNQLVSAHLKHLQEFGRSVRLNKFEIPVRIKLSVDEWSPDNGLVTAAMKIKRKNIVNKYRVDIDMMYDKFNNNF